jgi:hypothetical protein
MNWKNKNSITAHIRVLTIASKNEFLRLRKTNGKKKIWQSGAKIP